MPTETTETADSLFQAALARYQAGESAESLIPAFTEVCDRAQKSSPAWTCLAWLYLLADKPNQALKAAQKAVKLSPEDPQARINLAIAMLETGQKGVRPHIELAQHIVMGIAEMREEVQGNFEDGLKRKPDWKSLVRVQNWIFDA
jgi:predicted Zn-dependent protease